MGKLQRDRGAGYEREVCSAIEKGTGQKVSRKLGQARDSGNDIDLVVGDTQWTIECKRRRALAVDSWMDQAQAATTPGSSPMVVMRGDGQVSLAVVRLDDMLALLRSYRDLWAEVVIGVSPRAPVENQMTTESRPE